MSDFEKNNLEEQDEEMNVTLTLDDGSTVECVVLTIIEANNGNDYIALLPIEGPEAESGEVFLYRYTEDAEGNLALMTPEKEMPAGAEIF